MVHHHNKKKQENSPESTQLRVILICDSTIKSSSQIKEKRNYYTDVAPQKFPLKFQTLIFFRMVLWKKSADCRSFYGPQVSS